MDSLPIDILSLIFINLNRLGNITSKLIMIKDLLKIARVNKRFYNLIYKDNRIWKQFYKENLSDNIPKIWIKTAYINIIKYLVELNEENLEEIYTEAAEKGYEKIIYLIPTENIDISILEIAARKGNEDILFYLLDKGIFNKKKKRKINKKLISIAIHHGRIQLLEKLEKRGIKISIEDADEDYLTTAIANGKIEMVKYLEQKFNLKMNGASLETAIDSGNIETFKYVFNGGKYTKEDIDDAIANAQNTEQILYLWPYSSKDTENINNAINGLIRSKWDFDKNIIPLLILGADINYNKGEILNAAIKKNDLDAIKYLIKHKANLNEKYPNNPLVTAAFMADIKTFKYLIKKGANVNNIDKSNLVQIKKEKPDIYKIILQEKKNKK